jgi:hypothetical protein
MEGVSLEGELWVLDRLGAYHSLSQSRIIKGNVACITIKYSYYTESNAIFIFQNGTSLATVQGSGFIAQSVDAHSVCFGLLCTFRPESSCPQLVRGGLAVHVDGDARPHGAPASSPTGGNTVLCSDDGNNVGKEPVI